MRDDNDDLQELRRRARPDDLASLRRLDAALTRTGFRVGGKTVREWIADFASVRTRGFDRGDAVVQVGEAGLAAVPALVDTLRAERLDVPWKVDLSIRAQCIDALGHLDPLPTCAVPALLDALDLPSARVKRMALAVLVRMHPRATATALRALLSCLQDKQDAQLRGRAAQVLAGVDGPLPEAVRDAALVSLTDPIRFVRRLALQVLGRFPDDPKVLTALEEQAMLDDENRLEALRVLAELEPARAIPRLLDTAWEAGEARPQPTTMSSTNAFFVERARSEVGMKALLLIGRLGARATSALPVLAGYRKLTSLEPYADAAIDDIVRDVLRRRAPPLPTSPSPDARVAALLRDVPPPRLPADTPAWMLAHWAEELREQGPELTVRVALAVARRVLGLWEYQDPNNDGPRRAVMAMDAWLLSPGDALLETAIYEGYVVPSQVATPPEAFSACWSVTYATRCLPREEPLPPDAPPVHEDDGDPLGACVWAACRALSRQSVITWALGSSEESPDPIPPPQAATVIHRAILDEVLPWVHGTWDPVKDVARFKDELAGRGWKMAPPEPGRR